MFFNLTPAFKLLISQYERKSNLIFTLHIQNCVKEKKKEKKDSSPKPNRTCLNEPLHLQRPTEVNKALVNCCMPESQAK